ncbi:hypothetical protein [Chloroflexus sp.]|uniref:hypothetical protein n=1 Tax=Chloroflexus sp. TaxID=1904827 RepID=UPI002ADDCF98|nr:hypothetical protein [Chloroflexus sp.]
MEQQFRSAVREILTILLDEAIDPADRVKSAADILLGLPISVSPDITHKTRIEEHSPILYMAGTDGLPTHIEYIPDLEEGLLSEEEVAIMLREQLKG